MNTASIDRTSRSSQKLDGFIRQFAIARSPVTFLESWKKTPVGPFFLYAHPALPQIKVEDEQGTLIGILLGWPVSLRLGVLEDGRTYALDPARYNGEGSKAESDPAWLYEDLAGRWIFLSLRAHRIYLDPCGSQALVYSPSAMIAASTPGLIPCATKDYASPSDCETDTELVKLMDILESGLYYPFGTTHRRDVKRVVPNHYLCLQTWKVRRHYPSALEENSTAEAAATIIELSRVIATHLGAVWPLQANLTAGRDSRMLLACLRSHVAKIKFFTNEIPFQNSNALDLSVATRVARKMNLVHALTPYEKASEEESADWLARTGWCVAGNSLLCARTRGNQDPARCNLPANLGELGRAFFWKDGLDSGIALEPKELFSRLHLPYNESLLEAAANWLSELPVQDPPAVLDLLYLEQRVGPLFSVLNYGETTEAPSIYLWNHRRIMEAMMGLPKESKQAGDIYGAVIRVAWPELLQFPFNQDFGFRWQLRRLKRAGRRIIGGRFRV